MRNFWLLGILLLSVLAYAKTKTEYRTESDGFEWYQLRTDDGKYGAEDKNHKVLIKPQYDHVFYSTLSKGFYVRQNRYVGYYESDGKCVIPLSRKYRGDLCKLTMNDDVGKEYAYFTISTPKYSIICDAKGEEVLRTMRFQSVYPEFAEGKFFYQIQDIFDKYGILDGEGELVVPIEYCHSIYIWNDSLRTRDCFTDESISIAPLSSVTTMKNLLKQ